MSGRVHRGIRAGVHVADQAGFSLIELLVAMLVSIIVIGGGTWGMAMAFRSSSETSARSAATNQAEVRFAVLTRDLRQAHPCPTPLFSGLATAVYGNSLTLQMCDPAPGSPLSSAGSEAPQSALVTWTCITATESCARQTQNVGATGLTGTATTTNTITGVKSLTLTAIAYQYGYTNPSLYTVATLGTGNFSSNQAFQFSAPSFNDQNYQITWMGISAQIVSLKTPDSTSNLTQATGTAPVTFQTGVTLRNPNT